MSHSNGKAPKLQNPLPFDDFLAWEKASRDTIDFKKIYVDMAGDLVTGLLLSQIIYWYLPNEKGQSKLRVYKDGDYWIAKQLDEWWQEIRLTAKQVRRSLGILADLGIIEKRNFRFNGLRTNHIRILPLGFMAAWQNALKVTTGSDQRARPEVTKGNDRKLPKVTTESDQRARPITETTNKDYPTENTTESVSHTHNSFSLGKNKFSLKGIEWPITPLELYQHVTKIKDAHKIPEAVTEWLITLEPELFPEHYGCLRVAIRQAERDSQVFKVEVLEHYLWANIEEATGKPRQPEPDTKNRWFTDEEYEQLLKH